MNRRDIELLISARETTGRSFSQVTSNIDALNVKLAEQTKAAERGELSLAELRKTQEELARAGRDLSGLQGQIDAYQKLAANQAKASDAATAAVQDWLKLKGQIDAAGKSTDAQAARLERLATRMASTSAALEKNHADMAAQAEVLNRAGIATEQLETAQTGLVNAARNVGAGLTQVSTAIDGYAANIARARDAEQQLAAQQGFDRKIAEAQRLGEASRFVNLFAQAIDTAKAADNQLAALTGFRAVGQMASEAANDVSRFVQQGEAMAVSSRSVAAGLRAIIDPGGAALATLGGVEQAIREADQAAAEGVKNVNVLNTAYNNLAESSAALIRQASLVDTFQQQSNAAGLARTQFEQAQAEVIRLGQAMAQAEVPTEQLANELTKAEAKLEQTGRALAQEEARLAILSKELKNAGINTADLAGETARLGAAATQAGGAMQRISTATGRGGAKTNGIFGLRPQDLTQVGYQLNDIFVSLASGQAPLTVFIQQGAQLAQIPGLLSGVAGAIARFFPLIAILSSLAVVFGSVFSKAAQAREFADAIRDLNVATNNLDGSKLSDISDKLQRLGVDAKDAKKAIMSFAAEGLDAAHIEAYTTAAADAAKVVGSDFNEAVQKQRDVMTGGIDAVYALTESTRTLTDADLDHIEALYKDGKAAEAREYALARNKETLDAMARNSESIWAPAVRDLGVAWSNFAGWLLSKVQPAIQRINEVMREAAVGVTFVTGLLAGKGFQQAGLDAVAAVTPRAARPAATQQSIRDRQYLAQAREEYAVERQLTAQQRLRQAAIEARRRAQAAGASEAATQQAVAMAQAREQANIDRDQASAARRTGAARVRASREAEAAENRRLSTQRELENQLRQLNRAAFTGESASLEERLSAIDQRYESIYDTLRKMRSLGITQSADGTSLANIEQQVEATKERLKTEERIKFFQDQTALLQKQRDAEIERITEAQTRGAMTTQQAMTAAAEVQSRLSPQITGAAQQALTIARQLAGANPSPEMVSWIASLERIIAGEGTNNIVNQVGLDDLERQEKRLNEIMQERESLVTSVNALYEQGLLTREAADAQIKSAYAAAVTDSSGLIANLRQTVELLHQQTDALTGLPVISDTAYAAWQARLDNINASLNTTFVRVSELETQTANSIATGVSSAFATASSSMAEFIAGTKSLGDVFADVGVSILNTLASITQAIAEAIIRFLVLRALETAAGLPPGTLSGGGGSPKLFGLFHSGGVVGAGGGSYRRRTGGGDAGWIGAPKFHGGGGLGLRPDEYKAVLQRGEEVLTEDDPRHIRNIGKGGDGEGGGQSIKQVLLLDPGAVPQAMQTRSGQRAVLTTIRANAETIKQMLR